MSNNSQAVLALDWGDKRIGLALASLDARLAAPLVTLEVSDSLLTNLQQIIEEHNVQQLVVGYPRNQEGQATTQSQKVELAANSLRQSLGLPVAMQDESLTSVRAEQELKDRGRPYKNADIDALAATYILEDWLNEHKSIT